MIGKKRQKSRRVMCVALSSLFLLSLGSSDSVRAQESSDSEESDAFGGEGDVSSEKMTGREMIEWVEAQSASAQTSMSAVRRLTEQAGKEKDTIKITCLDDKMMQMSLSLTGVEERTEALRSAVTSGDLKSARQNFEILKIYFSRILGLSAEAENCLGESDVVLGKTETTMLISGDVTVEDPSAEDIDGDLGVEQPPQISGFY